MRFVWIQILPIKYGRFFSSNIIWRDVSCLSSWVLDTPPMFGIINEKKSFISFHVKFLKIGVVLLICTKTLILKKTKNLGYAMPYQFRWINYLISLCNIIVFSYHILRLVTDTTTWRPHIVSRLDLISKFLLIMF